MQTFAFFHLAVFAHIYNNLQNVVKPAASYHVTFTLLNGDTENTIFTWNFDEIFNSKD